MIHGHGDLGRVPGRAGRSQRGQVFDLQITIGIVGSDFFVTIDVLCINDNGVVRVRTIFSVVTRFDVDFFDIC